MVNANPGNEQELIALINLKVELLAELEKVPQEKRNRKWQEEMYVHKYLM